MHQGMRWSIGVLLLLNLIIGFWLGMTHIPTAKPVSQSQPDFGQLLLLSEVVDQQASDPSRSEAAPAPAESTAMPDPIPQMICWVLGDFPGPSQLATASAALPESVELLQTQQSDAQLLGYYVLVPGSDEPHKAQIEQQRLEKSGFGDTWHFRSGPLRGAISLGLFSQKSNAENYASKVRQAGFTARLQEKREGKPSYRLLVTGPDTEIIHSALQVLAGGGINQIDCPTKAR